MEKEVFIGIDIGTAGVRAIAFTPELEKLSSLYREHTIISTREDQAEQNPDEIYLNLIFCLRKVSHSYRKILGIGVSSVFHSLVGIDKKGNPLTPLYPFTDTRGKGKVGKVKKELPDFYQKTGCPPHPLYPAIKILWLKEDRPSIFEKIDKFISIKSYILHKLTGQLVEDTSVASGSGLLNVHNLCWDEEILEFLSLKKKNLPQVVEATEKLSLRSLQGLEKRKGVPVYPGAGDGVLCNLASGLKKDRVSSTVGSSGAIRIASRKPFLDERERTWCYHLYRNWWIIGGAINNGGLTLRWFKDKLYKKEAEEAQKKGQNIYEILNKEAQKSPPGANNLIFLPFLTGERAPNWNPAMRACFIGLALRHEAKDIIRSIMEGVMCRMRAVFDVFQPLISERPVIIASGGYIKSDLWLKIQANLFNAPINVMYEKEAASMGAVILALFAQEKLKNLEEFEPKIKKKVLPEKEQVEKYSKIYEKHIDAYRRLEGYFSKKDMETRGSYG